MVEVLEQPLVFRLVTGVDVVSGGSSGKGCRLVGRYGVILM